MVDLVLTHEILKELLEYYPGSGLFFWKERDIKYFKNEHFRNAWNARHSGKIAGTVTDNYIIIVIFTKNHYAHRLAWFYVNGTWPEDQILHDDQCKTNNAISNITNGTSAENKKNLPRAKNNKSGHTGVFWDTARRKWQAAIKIGGKTICLGRFSVKSDAIERRKEAEKTYGFHKNHGT